MPTLESLWNSRQGSLGPTITPVPQPTYTLTPLATRDNVRPVFNQNSSNIYSTTFRLTKAGPTNISTNQYLTPRTSINPSQPFIYIPPGSDNTTPGLSKKDGGAFLSTSNIKNDIRLLPYGVSLARDNDRILKFLRSQDGLLFIAKQFTLQAFNPYKKTKIFNPLAISGIPGVHIKRFVDVGAITRFVQSVRGQPTESSTTVGASEMSAGIYGNNGYFSDGKQQAGLKGAKYLGALLKEEFSTITSLGVPKKVSNITDPFNSKPVILGGSNNVPAGIIDYSFLSKPAGEQTKEDIISFRFKAVGNITEESTYIPFRAFINRITENVKPEYNEQRYIGRAERFITYAGTRRTVALDFNVAALSEAEIQHTWTRINYLTGLAFPKGISQSGFVRPQLFRISIGGIYQDQPCYIDTLDYEFLDENGTITFDIDQEVSKLILVRMNLILLEKVSRYYDSPFYAITQKNTNERAPQQIERMESIRLPGAEAAAREILPRFTPTPSPLEGRIPPRP